MEKRDSGMRGKCSKQGGEARIERYLEDGDGNDGPKMTLGRNWDTWKTNSPVTEPLPRPSSPPSFWCVCDCVDKTDLLIWEYLDVLNSNIQYLRHSAWAVGHTHTRTHSQFPLNGHFQQLSARRGNQALVQRLKSYQLHLFLSPCYHSHPLSNPPLLLTYLPYAPRDPLLLLYLPLSSHVATRVLTLS